MVRRIACAVSIAAVCGSLSVFTTPRDTDQERFASRADIVRMEVSVLDDQRRPVLDLQATDF